MSKAGKMQKNINVSIITIGDELLIGQVIDTNSAWIATQLNGIGIKVNRRVAVGDDANSILQALDEESKHANVVLITGGLGPTADDITKPLLCTYFNGRLVVNEAALANVKNIFENYIKRPLIERNLKQAEVPDNCIVLQNKRGTAPGMWFEKDDVIYISMPGVPYEMQGMITDDVIPALSQRFTLPFISHRTLLLAGIGESFIAEMILDFESSLPSSIKLAYLPNYGMLRLRLTLYAADATGEKILIEKFSELKQLVHEYVVIDDDIKLEAVIGQLLTANNKTIATAESCTGGYIAHLLTAMPGASAYFKGSIISYSNQIKEDLLDVQSDTLKNNGAVSEATVKEMVTGALSKLQTDYTIAVSGILGPDGGTTDKPVGTVWMAAGNAHEIKTLKMQFRFDRMRNMQLTAIYALNLLRSLMIAEL